MMAPVGLSEAESRSLLASYGIPFAEVRVVGDAGEAAVAAEEVGFPVVVKVSSDRIAHKSERGLVRVGIGDAAGVASAVTDMAARLGPHDGTCSWLVSPMIEARRELLVGLVRDESFGPFVLLGIGGVFAEAFADVALAPARPGSVASVDLIARLRNAALLGSLRGESAVDTAVLDDVLNALARLAVERPDIHSVDVNPLLIRADGSLVAVDALVQTSPAVPLRPESRFVVTDLHAKALFDPRGVVVVGVPTHPGKFGFVTLHNLLANGFRGRIAIVNRSGEQVLGITPHADLSEIPPNTFDLAVLCTPAEMNERLVREAATLGIRAVFVASAGYRESGSDGARAEQRLAAVARECDVLLIGPNGQGVVSTPASMCAQIVAPYPPAGSVSVVSQSGNLVSSFLNMACATGVGIARAVSVGNAATVGAAELLPALERDPATRVGLVYLENAAEGDALVEAARSFTHLKPLVVVKGGSTESGARAAASHTGALASSTRVVEAALSHAGVSFVDDVESAFDLAAAFATLPLPKGGRVAILTTVGGWGVLTADAIARSRTLRLAALSETLIDSIGALLPHRWSRSNPIDCAGGETRDTVPTILRMLVDSGEIDSLVLLGPGIQGNQAALMRRGRFYPDGGLERIVDYHERQEERYAEAVAEAMAIGGLPILVATELATTHPDNPFVVAIRARGFHCFPSGPRAIRSLDAMHLHAQRLGSAM